MTTRDGIIVTMVIGIAGGLVASALNVGDLDDFFDIGALLLAAEGLSNAVIAERLGASRQSVSEWRKRFFEQGVAGLEERPRPGRPRSFPRRRWPRSRRWRASCRASRASRSRAARALRSRARRSPRDRRADLRRDGLALVGRGRDHAGPILDFYEGRWEGRRLEPGDLVVCADEKPSIQARRRTAPTLPATRGQRVEHEYERQGALCYLAAWDARRAKLFDRCAQGRHRALRLARRAVHERHALQTRAARLPDHRYEQIATPFDWTFTRRHREHLLTRLDNGADRRVELRAT